MWARGNTAIRDHVANGVPAFVVRAGMDALGLPLAVQIAGARGADDLVLEVARSLYAETAALQETWPPMVARASIDSVEAPRRMLSAAQKSTSPTIQAGPNRLSRRTRGGYQAVATACGLCLSRAVVPFVVPC